MNNRIKAFFMAMLLVVTTVLSSLTGIVEVKAAEDLILKLHYHREDGAYDGWDAWLWEAGGDGAAYEFEEEDGEMVATKVITPGVTSVGFIVRTADWSKDVDEDQFIDISEMVSGTVHIYVESGVEGYEKEYGEDAVTGTKLTKAKYDGAGKIVVSMTGEIEGDAAKAFSVKGTAGNIALESAEESGKFEYTLSLKEELDLSEDYTITYDGNDYKVVMPDYYGTEEFESEYTYEGDDLGATWTAEKTTFRVWAPTAEAVKVNLYESGTDGTDDKTEELTMEPDVNGTWVAEKAGDLNGTYYTYSVTIKGETTEACDPYARTTGVNGKRAMVIDLSSTNPEGWDEDVDPHAGAKITDAVIYELHVRDLSSDESSGINNTGKFLGLTETGTTTENGVSTGLDHMKDLGITHLHLLPVYDYGSVDETKLDTPQFNWGYDPVNYNVPEGSYSTDPYHGEVRVKEMKEMVQTLHQNDISVVMDVVYNHVYSANDFCFNLIVPDYFSRTDENGAYSNGSGCGNDTASERSMVKKYIVDSVSYWADEYHIDGFRFDLVGLLDTETINAIVEEVHKDHPNVIFYGEGWSMDTTLTKDGYTMATQVNSTETPDFAYFSDTLRDLLKGSVFETTETGYISGAEGCEEELVRCFMGLDGTWCTTPSQTVHYASCHDNMTLMDRIARSTPSESREDRIRMNNLAAAIDMTAEGIPFFQAGEEMLRTKIKSDGGFDENSYASPDSVNSLKWSTLEEEEYQDVYQYYKGLIAFRKAHAALRLATAEETTANVKAVEGLEKNVVAFEIDGAADEGASDGIFVIFNANKEETEVSLPEGNWNVYVNDTQAGTEPIETVADEKVTVAPISALVLVKEDKTVGKTADQTAGDESQKKDNKAVKAGAIVVAAGAVIAGVTAFFHRKKRKK